MRLITSRIVNVFLYIDSSNIFEIPGLRLIKFRVRNDYLIQNLMDKTKKSFLGQNEITIDVEGEYIESEEFISLKRAIFLKEELKYKIKISNMFEIFGDFIISDFCIDVPRSNHVMNCKFSLINSGECDIET